MVCVLGISIRSIPVSLYSAHRCHHYPCPATPGPCHAPAHSYRAPFHLILGPSVPAWASQEMYLSPEQPQLCPCLATEPAGPAPAVAHPKRGNIRLKSARAPQAPYGISCWQEPPSKPTSVSALKLWVQTLQKLQTQIATAIMFQLKCKKKPKAFPPGLSATETGLTSASCSQA